MVGASAKESYDFLTNHIAIDSNEFPTNYVAIVIQAPNRRLSVVARLQQIGDHLARPMHMIQNNLAPNDRESQNFLLLA